MTSIETKVLRVFLVAGLLLVSAATAFALTSVSASTGQTQASTSQYTGYEVTGPYTTLRVEGSWIVPTADCSATPNSVSNISVIIDGINGEGDAMQIGTYQNCVGGVAQYGAFVNLYPMTKYYGQTANISKLVIHPGDVIEAQGTWRPSTYKLAGWNTNFIDETSGQTVDTDAHTASGFTPRLDSAALILSTNGTLTSLSTPISSGAQFTGVKFSDIAGPYKAHSTFGDTASLSGYSLVSLQQIPGTSLGTLTDKGSSFQITV
jgi:hypothetical protein